MYTKTKILSIFAAFITLMVLAPQNVQAASSGEKQMIMVSAYYSPLPGQRFYMRGSYEADLRLNGRGTNGADGTEVYIGMIAAPRTYSFGTRVRIPGLGVGEVHDRGGAILARRSYDRIDVWMGHGEDGLSRALNWGMRLVEGEVFSKGYQVEPGLSYNWVSSQLPKSTLNRLMSRTLVNPQVFTRPITQASPKANIKELQEALRMFGHYHGAVTGVYDAETREAVLTFQLFEGVILTKNTAGAGNFGPKTRAALKSKVENFNSKIVKEQKRLKENLTELTSGLGKKSKGEEVYNVQQMLWELGYYKSELHGNYDSNTIDAVFRFQKDHGVIAVDWDEGAGYYGKKTHQALVAAVDKKIQKIMKDPMEMQVWVPARIDLPTLDNLKFTEINTRRPLGFGLKVE